jgi:L-2-hydroxyglutarate oxidase LhgO
MDKVDVIIIGAGAVGLAIGRAVSAGKKGEIVVVEKHDSFGRETSSRNSEVIHAGFYYPAGSFKARLCVDGNRMLYEFCSQNSVQHKQLGKLVVGNTQDEIKKIHFLYEQGRQNGVPGLALLDERKIREMEPAVTGKEGLWSPTTGIMDSHGVMKTLERQIINNKATIAYQCEVTGIRKNVDGYAVELRDADGGLMSIESAIVINTAGLWADAIAEMVGIDVEKHSYRIYPCKGEYFSVSPRHKGKLKHLVYPAPTAISLGVHAVLDLQGSLKLGPNAYYVDSKTDYQVNPAHAQEFVTAAREFFPFIMDDDLSPDMSGIRPKVQHGAETFRDFIIRDESDKGLPGFINLIGIESPGLTSCLAIAGLVKDIIDGL